MSALVYLHSLGIVHCDVKPPNILIASDERARLADFDISVDLKTRVSVRYAKSKTTCVGYTPGFEAPELLTQGASAARHVCVRPGARLHSPVCVYAQQKLH